MLTFLCVAAFSLFPAQASDDVGVVATPAAANLPDWLPYAERGEALYLQSALVESNAQMAKLEESVLGFEKRAAAGESADFIAAIKRDAESARNALEQEQANLKSYEARLTALTSLFRGQNLWLWARFHGPPILGILFLLFVGLRIVALGGRTILRRAQKGGDPGDLDERIQRAETLVLVFRKAATIALWSVCIVAILGELGVNTTALAAALGLLGLAVSFGSQGLVKDFISGFFMLLENQLAIGDVISINGSTSGTVENFGMRVTVLRDGSGALHFIPNGSISRISNMTHGYSKTVFTIGAGYREDPDEVIAVIEKVLAEFANDADWADFILDAPSVLGVDSLGESEVSFKVSIKVTAGKQWGIRRELLKRLKIAFDLNDIEIPFPQRVHYTSGEQPESKTLKRKPTN